MSKFQEFVARLESKGYLKTNLFEVRFFGPQILGDKGRELTFYCMRTSLPDVGLLTKEVRRHGYGPMQKHPYRPSFTDLPLTYILDARASQVKYFQRWINSIIPFGAYETMQDDGMTVASGDSGGPYEVCYVDDYVTDVSIHTYDQTLQKAISYKLRDAFPREIRSQDVSWGEADGLMLATIVMAYTDFRVSGAKVGGDENEIYG